MKTQITALLLSVFSAVSFGQSIGMKISAYPNTNALHGTDLLIVADPGKTNYNISFSQLLSQLQTQIVLQATGGLVTTNPWAGPTNSLTLGTTNHYFYTASTPCSVTGFSYTASLVNQSVLTISNAASTNITFTILCAAPQEDASVVYTITNGFVLKSWIEFADGMTNSVTRVFRH